MVEYVVTWECLFREIVEGGSRTEINVNRYFCILVLLPGGLALFTKEFSFVSTFIATVE
jgi:hypothetical protein